MNSTAAEQSLGLAHYWAQGDAVSHSVAYVLLIMSILSWYYILSKAWSSWRIRRSAAALDGFWQAPTLTDAIATIKRSDSENVYTPLAAQSVEAANIKPHANSLNANTDPGELITRTLRQEINRVSSRLETGLTLLASVGSTAPFIGLFGTVWGIYHALVAVSSSGTIQIDKVAGPVGEALIMTALGLAVAIPAVLAYNAFTRVNRITLAELDAFAHDLHAYLTTGARVGK
ncbi:biopolymer transporter ExbB [Herminiimonas sp. KBW02]|jgi:biopolymer transport protein ExbB|uniref:Biopolymer transport protein ExbB n=1 Tax=Herminiimonas contaminans TaxID=1111140 RepID=A0ABS0EQL5_9BURK|nr:MULTISPECIES: MotA/TolQ/ExbB proton channel family protein [Oxalobacteraceae]MBF8176309.1 MotA/TolQ/ExbB proton channel family protein [Herminiimonas contaminans]MBX9800774.1 MotA/TolQ/ExbB proton channel family protein [Burkholderiaceae bacterium]RQO35015.1 biopolymer transporter ExbB [Herminiimonas sp. KBW02]